MIGGGVTVVSVTLFNSCVLIDNSQGNFLCLPFLFISPMLPFIDLFDNNPFLRSLPWFSFEIFSVVAWFITGSVFGAFINYIKSK